MRILRGMPQPPDTESRPRKSVARLLWLLLTAFIVYGTTIPFRFDLARWGGVQGLVHRIDWHFLGDGRGYRALPDIVQNILLFMPFGFLGYLSLVAKRSRLKLAAIVAMGAALSAFVEFLQTFSETRWPALSDVVCNTTGTALGLLIGIALKKSALELKTHPGTRLLVDAESAYPAFIFTLLAMAGAWEPFDFALSVPSVRWKLHVLLADPLRFTLPNDELITFIRFLLATIFVCRLMKECGLKRPGAAGTAAMALLGAFLEATHILVQSRAPELQGAVTALLGALAGGIAFRLPHFHERPRAWGFVAWLGILLSGAMRELYPFRFSGTHSGFNWIPFFTHHHLTSVNALFSFVKSGMAWFPMGFLVAYFFPGSPRAARLSTALAFVSALLLEWAQGYARGRYADVTDAAGAVLGNLAGILVMTRGWKAFRDYMAWEEV